MREKAVAAVSRLADVSASTDGAADALEAIVQDLSRVAMRLQTVAEALNVRAHLARAFQDLDLLSVREDLEDDTPAGVARPMIAEARRRLAAVVA